MNLNKLFIYVIGMFLVSYNLISMDSPSSALHRDFIDEDSVILGGIIENPAESEANKKDYEVRQSMDKSLIFSRPSPFHGQSPTKGEYVSQTYPKPVHIRAEDARRLAENLQLQANTRAIAELRKELNDIKRAIGE